MIEKFLTVCIVCFVLSLPPVVAAQESENKVAVPPGMELIKVGGTNVLIPQGTKVTKKDALLILEPPEQFMARKILVMEEEITDLKEREEALSKEIERLKRSVERLEKPAAEPTMEIEKH